MMSEGIDDLGECYINFIFMYFFLFVCYLSLNSILLLSFLHRIIFFHVFDPLFPTNLLIFMIDNQRKKIRTKRKKIKCELVFVYTPSAQLYINHVIYRISSFFSYFLQLFCWFFIFYALSIAFFPNYFPNKLC